LSFWQLALKKFFVLTSVKNPVCQEEPIDKTIGTLVSLLLGKNARVLTFIEKVTE